MNKILFIVLICGLLLLSGCPFPDGRGVQPGTYQLTDNDVDDRHPVLSSDGKKMVWVTASKEGGNMDTIVLYDIPTKNRRDYKVKDLVGTDLAGFEYDWVKLSGNGTKVVFIAAPVEPGRSEYAHPSFIYVMDFITGRVEVLTEEGAVEPKSDPGETITRQVREEYPGEDAERGDPKSLSISDDADTIVAGVKVWGVEMGGAHDVDTAVAVMNATGANFKLVAKNAVGSPQISGSGDYIAYREKIDDKYKLKIINTGGAGEKTVDVSTYDFFVGGNAFSGKMWDNEKGWVVHQDGTRLQKNLMDDAWTGPIPAKGGSILVYHAWDEGMFKYYVDSGETEKVAGVEDVGNCAKFDTDSDATTFVCSGYEGREDNEIYLIVK